MISKVSRAIGFILFIAALTSFHTSPTSLPLAKRVEQMMVKINDGLYASKYEVTNLEYRDFLTFINTKNGLLAGIYKVDSAKWISGAGYGEPMAQYYHVHPAYNNYPVVNISYDAALAYCEWLTDQYNADAKRKFQKVRFFIPSEETWMQAAGGGDKNKMYPWANYYLRNRTGQFLCNFKHLGDESITFNESTHEYRVISEFKNVTGSLSDRSIFTTAVNAFDAVAPYGIHNMSGNVAEMVIEKGIAKGGSYNSPGYDVRIQSKMTYTDASPEIGFRVFMQIDDIETGELIKPKKGEKSNPNRTY